MAIKPSRKKRHEDKIHHKLIIILILISCLFFLAIYINYDTNKKFPETKSTEVKKLPLHARKLFLTATTSASFRIPILMYHYVEFIKDKKDTIRQSLNVNPTTFEEQVKTLKGANYTFMTARDLGEVFDGERVMPYKPVLLTFDDGHWDLHTDVLPIFEKYNAKGTIYMISGFLDGSDFLSKEQLIELSKTRFFEIGAHTVNHAWLKDRPENYVKEEIKKSKEELEKIIKMPVVSFAYPYGAFDQQTEKVLKDTGFKTSVITVPGIIDSEVNRFFLFRLRPGGRVGEELLNYLEQSAFNL